MTQYNHLTHNKKTTLLVISTYPTAKTTHTGGGLASYTKNTLLAIKKTHPQQKIVVLANILDKPETYLENNILVIRCWRRNFPAIYLQLLRQIFQFDQINKILFGFEFSAYGDFWITSFVPVFVGLLHLLNKRVITVIHQIILQLANLSDHIGIRSNLVLNLYNTLLQLYYRLLVFTSSQVISLEPILAKRLSQLTNSPKVNCIPHGLNLQKQSTKKSARQKLHLSTKPYYVLAFGFLSHYKGSDLLAQAFQKPLTVNGRPVKLILAGGESPTQGHKSHYRDYYSNLYKLAANKNIISTGFVDQSLIKAYFSAANLAVFPYRNFMSASGPVALALSFGLPSLVSADLNHYSPLITTLNPTAIRQSIRRALTNKNNLHLAKLFANQLASDRRFTHQTSAYLNLLNLNHGQDLSINLQPSLVYPPA